MSLVHLSQCTFVLLLIIGSLGLNSQHSDLLLSFLQLLNSLLHLVPLLSYISLDLIDPLSPVTFKLLFILNEHCYISLQLLVQDLILVFLRLKSLVLTEKSSQILL
jgi:hypothetical protein